MCIGDLETRPIVDNECIAGYKLFKVLPAMDVLKAIGTHDNGELLKGKFLGEIGKGIDSVRWLRQVKLYIAGAEFRIVLYSQVHKVQPVVLVKQRVSLLKRVVRRHYEP